MKTNTLLATCLALTLGSDFSLHAQGTAFTYQGRLSDTNGPVTGYYDFFFSLYDSASNETGQIGSSIPYWYTPVTNGLFTVTLNFGNVFTGNAAWLKIIVRTNGAAAWTTLSPRQPLTPAPQAVYASSAGAAGTATNVVAGAVVNASVAAGANISDTKLATISTAGKVADSALSGNVALLNSSPTFAGIVTAGGKLRASGLEVGTSQSSPGFLSSISGGAENTNSSGYSLIGGGYRNQIQSDAYYAVIAGGNGNLVESNADYASIGGGSGNLIPTNAQYATIPGGKQNAATNYAFAAGRRAKARHEGAFVWADSTDADFTSGANNQFLIRAAGGVGIGTNNPQTALHVNGTVTATSFTGGGILNWQTVPGLTQQAQPNTGYLITNPAQVTITLPTSPNVGDIVRISGVSAGGWKTAQNTGQSVRVGNVAALSVGVNWTPYGISTNWRAVASSADGSKLVAVVDGWDVAGGHEAIGQIYTSSDSGVTWTARENSRHWGGVASSADGSKLVAVVSYDAGQIYTSTDSGVTWTARESSRTWGGVASSADGSKLVAYVRGNHTGQIYTSTDSGVTWTPQGAGRYWEGVASSSDGTKLVAVVGGLSPGGKIYTSTDSGVTWTPRESDRRWQGVASSADGSKLVAVDAYGTTGSGGQIYTSTDSGVTWTARDTNRGWNAVASSADGSKLVAAVYYGQIYTSIDSGVTWTPRETSREWMSVASSADGTKLVAVGGYTWTGQIYISTPTFTSPSSSTTTGTGGYLVGGQGSSIELQYVGNNEFIVLTSGGTIFAY